MKLSVNLPVSLFPPGGSFRAEVVQSDESRSLLLVNGVHTVVQGKLQTGSQLSGTVVDGGGQGVVVQLTHGLPAGEVGDKAMLQAMGIPPDEKTLLVMAALRRYGLVPDGENLMKALEILKAAGTVNSKLGADVAGLMLSRNVPMEAVAIVKAYLSGELNLGKLLSGLTPEQLAELKEAWISRGALAKILASLTDPSGLARTAGQLKTLAEVASSLQLQEMLSVPGNINSENKVFFQWPIFWADRDVPDTLEGEAFHNPSGVSGDDSFSLRIMVNPPSLGRLEVGIHRLKHSLWVHFGAGSESRLVLASDLFPMLRSSLLKGDWTSVRLTTGALLNRSHFLAPPEQDSEASEYIKPNLDLRA